MSPPSNVQGAGLLASLSFLLMLLAGCQDRSLPTAVLAKQSPEGPSLNVSGSTCTVYSSGRSGSGTLHEALMRDECTNIEISQWVVPNSCHTHPPSAGPCVVIPLWQEIIDREVNIVGFGASKVALSAEGYFRVFYVVPTGKLSLTGVTVTGGAMPYGQGGAIRNEGQLTLTDVVITGNSITSAEQGDGRGGGLSNFGTLVMRRSTVSNNEALFDGGGIVNYGTMSIEGSTIEGNSSSGNGGGIANFRKLSIINSTISGNVAAERGGGLYGSDYGEDTLVVTNSTFSGNAASSGGGISTRSFDGIVRLAYITVANNTAAVAGGVDVVGISYDRFAYQLTHSVLTGNGAGGVSNLAAPDYPSYYFYLASNFIGENGQPPSGGPSETTTQWTTFPEIELPLGPLAENGGLTKTHALLPGNKAIDMPSCNAAYTIMPVADQRGVARPQGFSCDAGAYELEDETPPVITSSVTGTLGYNDWYVGDVTVTWSVVEEESPITSSTGCATTVISADTPGTTLTCTTTSSGGTSSESVTIKRDVTPPTPTFTYSPDPLILRGAFTTHKGAIDATSGVLQVSCTAVNAFVPGRQWVSCDAYDNAGNYGGASFAVYVGFAFSGFAAPLGDEGVMNKARAGQTIPLKWRIVDANGAPVTEQTYAELTVLDLTCSLGSTVDQIEEYSAGASGLQEIGDGYYQLNWKSPSSYSGSCKALQLRMADGVVRTANFQFTK